MTNKEMIEVINAHIEGKQIQFWDEGSQEWLDCVDNEPCWEFGSYDYRAKPESKTRPYKDREECWNDMQKHEPFGWLKVKDTGDYVMLGALSGISDFTKNFKNHIYADGSPFGIIEED